MSIPMWRSVRYTDDGCAVFQCLHCYTEWEARTNPAYANWKFCPICGCKWEGEKEVELEQWRYYRSVYIENNKVVLPPIRPSKFAIEERLRHDEGEWSEWSRCCEYNYEFNDRIRVVQCLKELREKETDEDYSFGIDYEYRIVKV